MSYSGNRTVPTVARTAFEESGYTDTPPAKDKVIVMLHYAVVFFVIALIAAVFGFGGIAAGAASIAKILFVVFLIGAVISFLMSLGRRV